MPNDYATTTDVKAAMPSDNMGDTYDTILGLLVTRASREIDRFTKHYAGYWYATTDETRYFDGSGTRIQAIDDIISVPTTVEVSETADIDAAATTDSGTYTTWATSDYLLFPYNAAKHGKPYNQLHIDQLNGTKFQWYSFPKSVKITAIFGYANTVPPEIQQATILQAARWLKRGLQGFQDTGAIVELSKLVYTKGLDPMVEELLYGGVGMREVAI